MAERTESPLGGRRVLVTGASGFIGNLVVAATAAAAGEPLPMVRKGSDVSGLEKWRGSFRYADLRDDQGLLAALDGAEIVVHVAGLTRARSLAEFEAVNVQGVGRLATACLQLRPRPERVVLVSSLAAAGPNQSGPPVTEDVNPRPCTDYGRSKLNGEARLMEVLGDQIPWTIVRPPIVYGPGERDLLLLFRMCRRGLVPLLRGGRVRYSVVFGPDLAATLLRLAVHPAAAARIFNVCEAVHYSYRELVEHIGAAVGRRPWTPRLPVVAARLSALCGSLTQPLRRRPTLLSLAKLPEILATGWTADASRLRSLLDDPCPTPFAEGTRMTAAWYRQAGWI